MKNHLAILTAVALGATCTITLFAKGLVSKEEVERGKALLHEIVSMLVGLIRANDSSRIAEEPLLLSETHLSE